MRHLHLTIISVIILTGITACTASKALREERKQWGYANWEEDFKDRTLCLCVLQGLNNKALKDSILVHDKSFYNPFAYAVFDSTINSLLQKELAQMQADSIRSIGKYPIDIRSALEGKRVMSHCLELYRSKRLSELAKKEKKQWKKIENIMDKIHEKVPTF